VTYLKTFLITVPLFALVGHFVPDEPMRWWPDAAVFGGFMGALSAFAVMRFLHFRRAGRATRRVGGTLLDGVRRRQKQVQANDQQ
jgi:hypothetical protein